MAPTRIIITDGDWAADDKLFVPRGPLPQEISGLSGGAPYTVSNTGTSEEVIPASATFDIYVDSVNGNDSNNGRTPATAFRTLAALPAPYPYMRISLAAGSRFRESLNWADHDNITIAAYGDLAAQGMPIVDGAHVITGAWTTAAERGDAHASVYSRSVTITDTAIADGAYPLHWENGTRLAWASSLASCQATPGTWYSPELSSQAYTTTGTYTLHVHPFGSTNPNADGKTYERVARVYGLRLGNNATISRIRGMRVGHNSGAFEAKEGALFDRLLGEECLRHCMLAASGVMQYCVGWMQADDPRTGHILLEFYAFGVPSDATGRWVKCIAVVQNKLPGVSYGSGFGGHTSNGSRYALFELDDCAVRNTSVSSADVVDMVARRLRMDNAGWRPTVTGKAHCIDPYLTVTGRGFQSEVSAGFTAAGDANVDYLVEGARILVDGDLPTNTNSLFRRTTAGGTALAKLRRSAVRFAASVDAGSEAVVIRDDLAAGREWNLEGNIFDIASAPNRGRFFREVAAGTILTGTNNVYYLGTQTFRFSNGTADQTATARLAAQQPGNEAGSVVADPQLANPAAGDFRALASGLPANSGLERPDVPYTPIPDTLAEAEEWILAAV